ncbi:unnamed protein product [Polarella glacialis]|uniref:Uncharacterized protein n=1 Tax=Polarella glacialis TaxID=89957 RepID=A0A813K264_POLGL|nr:unnamed protein product [Polarella glacialis]
MAGPPTGPMGPYPVGQAGPVMGYPMMTQQQPGPMMGQQQQQQQQQQPFMGSQQMKIPSGYELGPILMAGRVLPPQPMMDSAPDDGPVSVAFGLRPQLVEIRPRIPCPDTKQYIHRRVAREQEERITGLHPRVNADVCGWVMATADPNDPLAHCNGENLMQIPHNEFRLVFQSISGFILMHWSKQHDFEQGIYGARRAPRPIAWWDLRQAFDLCIEDGDPDYDVAPHRFTVMMKTGNVYFCVELAQDVPIWYNAIRAVIQDASWGHVLQIDTPASQRKRWAAACGVADALLDGRPLGERALAILYTCFDIDMDCTLRVGEIMLLIQELRGALIQLSGSAEGAAGRESAIESAMSRMPRDELFERALRFRRRVDADGNGTVSKHEFLERGHHAMLEALDMLMKPGSGYAGDPYGEL